MMITILILESKKVDVSKAVQMWAEMLTGGKAYGADSIIQDFVYEEYEEVQKCYPHGYHGVDKEGRPVYIERLGKVERDSRKLLLRFPACSVSARRHIDSCTTILDVQGMNWMSFGKVAHDLVMRMQKIDGDNYPETLHQMYIVNAVVDSNYYGIQQKVLGNRYQNKLLEAIDASQLPDFLGGTCSCPNEGGCLRSDKGPWNDLELMKVVNNGDRTKSCSFIMMLTLRSSQLFQRPPAVSSQMSLYLTQGFLDLCLSATRLDINKSESNGIKVEPGSVVLRSICFLQTIQQEEPLKRWLTLYTKLYHVYFSS
uniref:Putative CRAL-TRIO lipid binding domain-containing protein n=1 Tax=Helianthus annuus TaxID=4232 RepID=A0A251RWF2_HELAN